MDNEQVNVNLTKYPELMIVLDRMAHEDGTDRSKFIRNLIRREAMHRDLLPQQSTADLMAGARTRARA